MHRIEILKNLLEKHYETYGKELLFHGWHHIVFVWKKSILFAQDLKADQLLVQAAALTHDLNYVVDKNSSPKAWEKLRTDFLEQSGFTHAEIEKINAIIIEEEIAIRTENISIEAQALSDADTLFKVLPITPILFTNSYIIESGVEVSKLAQNIVKAQLPLMEQWIYFYSNLAKSKYLHWAQTNINLWKNVQDAYEDEEIGEMLAIAKKNEVI